MQLKEQELRVHAGDNNAGTNKNQKEAEQSVVGSDDSNKDASAVSNNVSLGSTPFSRRHQKYMHRQIKAYERRLKKVQNRMRRQAASIARQSRRLALDAGISLEVYRELLNKHTKVETQPDGKEPKTVDYTAINRDIRILIIKNREARMANGQRKKTTGRHSDRKAHSGAIAYIKTMEGQ